MIHLALPDILVFVSYMTLTIGIGLYFAKKASRSTEDYFLAGRSLPWWFAGISMVATSFATDAPLAATRLIREEGIAGFWYPTSWLFADLVTLYFFSRLWRRAQVATDVEITELRYNGKPAEYLRLISGLFNAIPFNCIIIGWVTLAMVKILEVSLGLPKEIVVPILVTVTVTYTCLSGMWGAAMNHLLQYSTATIGALALAWFSINKVGGMPNLVAKLSSMPEFGVAKFNFFPTLMGGQALTLFLVIMAVQWWAQKNVTGGGQLSLHMFACKDEKHSFLAVFLFSFLHYVIRPWPWMVVGLCSLVLFPHVGDNEAAYPMMFSLLPVGLKGLVITSLTAAYMSTLETHLNWGSSYLITDVYRRFIKKDGTAKHYVFASRMAMLALSVIVMIVVFNMGSIVGAWKYLATLTAGVGPVFILRWYWHRINAWSEISALLASGFFATVFSLIPFFAPDQMYGIRLLLTLGLTTITWLTTTYFTAPTEEKVLLNFYRRVRPASFGWGPIAKISGTPKNTQNLAGDLLAFVSCAIFLLSSFFAIGKYILGATNEGHLALFLALISGLYVFYDLQKRLDLKLEMRTNDSLNKELA